MGCHERATEESGISLLACVIAKIRHLDAYYPRLEVETVTHFILEEPPTRIGICCGEGCGEYSLLFKITGLYRYRCAECYTKEVGHRPPNEPLRWAKP